MFSELMYNPLAWLFLSLCTVFSLMFAIYTWIVGNKKKEISVESFSYDIVKNGKQPIPKLEIKFNNEKIQELSSTIFYIWNSGNDVINRQDMVATKWLEIKSDKHQILDAQIIKQSDDSNEFHIFECTSEIAKIEYDYIDSGEGVKLQILHTGSGSELKVEGKIKGGKAIRDDKKIGKQKKITALLQEGVPMLFLSLSILLSNLILPVPDTSNLKYIIIELLLIFVIAFIMILVYKVIGRKIKTAFYRSIPQDLRE